MNSKAPLTVNLLSESEGFEAQGVHTAFVDMVAALKSRKDVNVLTNSREVCSLLHAHTFGPLYWMRRGPYRGRRIMTAHVVPGSFIGSLALAKYWAPISDWYLKFSYNSADLVLCVAPQVKRDLEKIGVSTRMEVLTNPVNGDRFFPSSRARIQGRRLLKLAPKDKVCLCVGQIQPRKGVAEFIEAARRLPEFKFVWLGGRPFKRLTADFDALNQKMAAAPKNVIFAGVFKLDAMASLYNAADLFFFPSYQENCALAINEAMACGIPMLLRDNPEYLELYGPHYLKAMDASGYATQIRRIFSKPSLRRSYRLKSLRSAKRFSVTAFTEKLVGLYKSLLLSSQGTP
jgi:1,2-diacylglycerol-3-alpha-glucose alpha-1,2-galactosyltransferase